MPRAPLYALAAALSLIAAIAIFGDREPEPAFAEVPPAPRLPDSPPSTGAVLAGAVDASVLTAIEEDLTEQAAARSTSTTSTSTTTTPTTTTTTISKTSDGGSSPPAKPSSPKPSPGTTTTTEAPAEEKPSGGFDSGAESQFDGLIDSLRSSNGLTALARNGSLDAHARDWARHMGESGSLSHSNLGSLMPPWTSVAENVGQGGSVSQVFDLLNGSSGHRSNMLGDFTHVGIGVWRDANGTIWTVHVFAR